MPPAKKAPVQKEKQKPIGYVNFNIVDENGQSVMRSNRGFSVFDNEHCTKEERALIDLAKQSGGKVTLRAELIVIEAKETPTEVDLSTLAGAVKAA